MGESWRDAYEDDNFREELEALLEQLRPLYQQLHTYVRRRLMDEYGEVHFPASGHIPAHILGEVLTVILNFTDLYSWLSSLAKTLWLPWLVS